MCNHMLYPPEPSPLGYRECPDCNGEGEFDESDCCGAPIILGDICRECREHCSKTTCAICEGQGEILVTEEYLEDLKLNNSDYEEEPLNNYF